MRVLVRSIGSTPTAVPRTSASWVLASVLGRARGPAQRRGWRTRTKQRRPWWHCLVVARRDARMLARKAAARTRRAERRKRWTIWDGIAQWGAPTLGSLAFMMTTGFLLLGAGGIVAGGVGRSEEHTSEIQSLMRISYAVFCLKKQII